jgi:Fanconi anemia group M protein
MLEAKFQKYLEHPLIWPKTIEFRLYQKRIADIALKKNTLVILPTALGKTIISTIVAAEILYNYKNSRVLVMAPTKPLILQHRESFCRILKLREKDSVVLTGKTPPSLRAKIWQGSGRVVFSTPQVVRNDIRNGRLSLENYGLLVFDECHRAVKRYAYTEVAQYYADQAQYPLILGMTASPGSNLNRILEVCKNLFTEHVEYRTEEDPDVKPYIHNIDVMWRKVKLPFEYLKIKSSIKSMIDRRVSSLYYKGIIKFNPKYVTKTALIKAGDDLRFLLETSIEEERSKIFTAILNQSLAVTLFHMLELLETQGIHTLKAFMSKVDREKKRKKSYAIMINDPQYSRLRILVNNCSLKHPKIGLLLENVTNQLQNNSLSRMLVFTQYRDTAKYLVEELNKIESVKAARFVGQSSKINDKGLSQEEQAERIRMLRECELNILVATSIAEEGLDIPEVDQVIFYEPIPSEIRYIQRRGRTGRRASGKVMILATSDTLDMIYLYSSRKRSKKMRIIAENLNSNLKPIIRKSVPLPLNRLTQTYLMKLEEEIIQNRESHNTKTEDEIVKELKKDINRTSRNLYTKLLEKGICGASITQLISEMTAYPPVIESAIKLLVKEGWVTELYKKWYTATPSIKGAESKTYKIQFEKISHGSAIVRVDDKWKARLDSQEYNGPKNIVKKNKKFRALAKMYRLDGTLCIRINDVTAVLD